MKTNALGINQPNPVRGSVIIPAEPKPNTRPRNALGEPVNDPVTGNVIIPKESPLNKLKLPTSLRKRKATRKNRKNRKGTRKH